LTRILSHEGIPCGEQAGFIPLQRGIPARGIPELSREGPLLRRKLGAFPLKGIPARGTPAKGVKPEVPDLHQ